MSDLVSPFPRYSAFAAVLAGQSENAQNADRNNTLKRKQEADNPANNAAVTLPKKAKITKVLNNNSSVRLPPTPKSGLLCQQRANNGLFFGSPEQQKQKAARFKYEFLGKIIWSEN